MATVYFPKPGDKKKNQDRYNAATKNSQSISDYISSGGNTSTSSNSSNKTGSTITTMRGTGSGSKSYTDTLKENITNSVNNPSNGVYSSLSNNSLMKDMVTAYNYSTGSNVKGPSSSTKPVVEEVIEEEELYNPYEDKYNELKAAYDRQEELLREQNRLAVEQGVNRLNAQKNNINQSADENARQAYVQYMQSQKALPQQLASQGVSGGATETANLGLQTAYQNNVNAINQNKANRLQEIDNAIVDLQNTGDLSTVEQVLANNQAALDAYMNNFDKGVAYNQWAQQFNANREDTLTEQAYRDKVYADQLAQQNRENQWYEQSYKDQMAQQDRENQWYEQNYTDQLAQYQDAKKQEELNRILQGYFNGYFDAGYTSAQTGIPVEYLYDTKSERELSAKLERANTQSLINNRNSGGNGGNGGGNNTPITPYKSSDTSIANYINGQLGKNVINYNETTKKYGLSEVENGDGYLTNQQVYNWYKDPIIQKVLIGVNDGTISSKEGTDFLLNLGYSAGDIARVKGYTFEQEGE